MDIQAADRLEEDHQQEEDLLAHQAEQATVGGPGGGGGGGKLGGNPPSEFDGDRSKAITFMNEFNLYRLANIDAEQMTNPMKRTALLLGFIKGPNVKDWVRLRTDEMLARYNRTGDSMDEHIGTIVGQEYMQAFQDTASRERAEEKLRHLSFIPGDVDTFIAQFRTLADEAMYPLNAKPTISLFASKLPFRMMEHIYKITRPMDFNGWADGARAYHQDNTAVHNIRGVIEDTPKKSSSRRRGIRASNGHNSLG